MPFGKKLKPFTGIVKTTELPRGGFVGSVKALDVMQRGSMKPPKASLKRGRAF